MNFPIRLTNKLGHVNNLVSIDDFPPTDQDLAVKNELTEKINTQLKSFNELVDREIEEFNRSFNELNLDYLSIEEN